MNDLSIKIAFESKLTYLPILRKVVRTICSDEIRDNEKFFQDIDLCLNEALSNTILHAYQNESDREVQIIVTLRKPDLTIQIIDEGLKISEDNQHPQFKITDHIEALPESGFGIFILHQLMDEVVYKTVENKNILFLRKSYQ